MNTKEFVKKHNIHSGKLDSIATNSSETINDDTAATAAGMPDGNVLRRNGKPAFFIHLNALVISQKKIISLEPILFHKWTKPFVFNTYCFLNSPFSFEFNWGKNKRFSRNYVMVSRLKKKLGQWLFILLAKWVTSSLDNPGFSFSNHFWCFS